MTKETHISSSIDTAGDKAQYDEIYIGKIVNGKETVEDFLTGKRTVMEKENWLVTVKPELRIINDDVFEMVKKIKIMQSL